MELRRYKQWLNCYMNLSTKLYYLGNYSAYIELRSTRDPSRVLCFPSEPQGQDARDFSDRVSLVVLWEGKQSQHHTTREVVACSEGGPRFVTSRIDQNQRYHISDEYELALEGRGK